MRSKAILASALVAALGFSSASFAQGWDRGDHRDHRDDRQFRHEQRHDRNDRHAMGNRGDWREHGEQHRYYYGARGPEWRRGGYLPHEYRNHQYVVDDWRGHRLSRPPRGYQWVQVGNDYVLAAIASGLIANLIINQ